MELPICIYRTVNWFCVVLYCIVFIILLLCVLWLWTGFVCIFVCLNAVWKWWGWHILFFCWSQNTQKKCINVMPEYATPRFAEIDLPNLANIEASWKILSFFLFFLEINSSHKIVLLFHIDHIFRWHKDLRSTILNIKFYIKKLIIISQQQDRHYNNCAKTHRISKSSCVPFAICCAIIQLICDCDCFINFVFFLVSLQSVIISNMILEMYNFFVFNSISVRKY